MRTIAFPLAALLLIFATSSLAETAPQLVEQGLAAAEAGRFDEAATKFTALIARSPRVPELSLFYISRADAYVHGGHYDLAWADLTEAIALDPKHAKAHYLQGFILDQRNEPARAIEAYTRAIALDPKDADSLYNRGVDLYGQGRMEEAIKDFTQTIASDSKHASAYINRGAAYGSLGRFEAALGDLGKAIRLDPQSINAYINRARIHMMQREWAAAIKDCDAGLRIVPQNDVLIRLRAEAQMKK